MRGAVLVILSALLNTQSGGCAPSPSCAYPPFKWCSSLATAVQCGVRTATYSNTCIYPDLYNFTSKKSDSFITKIAQDTTH